MVSFLVIDDDALQNAIKTPGAMIGFEGKLDEEVSIIRYTYGVVYGAG